MRMESGEAIAIILTRCADRGGVLDSAFWCRVTNMIYRYFTRRDLSVFPAELDNDDLTVIWDWVNATVKGEVISAWPRQDDEEQLKPSRCA